MKSGLQIILALVGVLAGSAARGLAEETNRWSFDVVPYVWVAGVDVETSLPSAPPSSGGDADRFVTRITGAAMLAAQVRYDAFGLFADFAWLRLNTEGLSPGPAYDEVKLRSDFVHVTTALTYEIPLRGKFHASALAGARLWYVSEEVNATGNVLPGFTASEDKTWVDPLVGADLRYNLGGRWALNAKGAVGGFGVAADFAGEVMVTVSYAISDRCSVSAGYRYLHEEYDRSHFSFDLNAHGFLLGVGLHF